LDANESQLWEHWVGERDRSSRDALILLHASWARLVARDVFVRVGSRNTEWNEFTQNATLGLIEAVDRYDPSRGVEFRTYARHRVRGAVFNGLRQLWAQGIVASRDPSFERSESLIEDDGDPLESLVSWTVGVGIGHLLDIASLPEGDACPPGPYATLEHQQRYELLRKLVRLLPDRESMVLTLHYFQHVQFVEIARLLSVTKGRISQLHKRGINRLREYLREYTNDLEC
jgi:RNA polymerase sigma factor for flagellar operon FliA